MSRLLLRDRAMSRRRFMQSAAAGLAAASVSPASRAAAQDAPKTGCAYVEDLAKNWDIVRPMLATRYHRMHHCIFHYIRNSWSAWEPETQQAVRRLGWGISRPWMVKAKWDKRPGRNALFISTDNHSGEDFLYYHRWMLKMVDAALAAKGKGPIEPWSDADALPRPSPNPKEVCDGEQVPDFTPVFENPEPGEPPVNVEWLQARVKVMKTPEFFWSKMNWWGPDYRDHAMLATQTLGALGSRLEWGVHNQMHIRWSAYPTNGAKRIRLDSDDREKWDDPGYDTLFDEYSSHVGPIFYRLHKWIDNRVEDWAEAHGRGVVRYTTPHGFDWFRPGKWVNVEEPWTGAFGFDHPSPDEERRRMAVMGRVWAEMFPRPVEVTEDRTDKKKETPRVSGPAAAEARAERARPAGRRPEPGVRFGSSP